MFIQTEKVHIMAGNNFIIIYRGNMQDNHGKIYTGHGKSPRSY